MENAVKAHAGNKLTDDVAGKNPQPLSPHWTDGDEKDKSNEQGKSGAAYRPALQSDRSPVSGAEVSAHPLH